MFKFNSIDRTFQIDKAFLAFERHGFILGRENNEQMKEYFNYMVDMAVIFGANRTKAEQELNKTLDFQIELAKVMYHFVLLKN